MCVISPIVRLLTYNIHGCVGHGSRYDAGRILDVIQSIDADIVSLQEVYDDTSKDRQFLRELEALPYRHLEYGITLMDTRRGAYGNALLSKWPLANLVKRAIGIDGYEPRGAMRGRVMHPHGVLSVTASHLGLMRKERLVQLSQLSDLFNDPENEKIAPDVSCFMGDFNEWRRWGTFLSRLKLEFGTLCSLRTFPARLPVFALDQIYVKPERAILRRFAVNNKLTRTASDHLPLVADLDLSLAGVDLRA